MSAPSVVPTSTTLLRMVEETKLKVSKDIDLYESQEESENDEEEDTSDREFIDDSDADTEMDSDDDFELEEEFPKGAKKRRLPERKSKKKALKRMRKWGVTQHPML